MDRLTEIFSNGQAASYWCGSNCKYDHKYCRENLENCPAMEDILEKLAHYEDLAEAGRLIELPCAVGDTVYIVQYEDCNNGKCPWFNDKLGCSKGGIGSEYCPQDVIEFEFELEDLGRKIYLTREEAEAALKERESE